MDQNKETQMYLYFISQNKNNNYDTYGSAVVVAPDEDHARMILPGDGYLDNSQWEELSKSRYSRIIHWCERKYVTVKLLGIALPGTKMGIIIESFRSG